MIFCAAAFQNMFYKIWAISFMPDCGEALLSNLYNIYGTLVGNKIVDHSDVVGASRVGAAPTTSSSST